MATVPGTARAYSSTAEMAWKPFVKGPDYAGAWKALMAMATPEMKAMMTKAMDKVGGDKP